MESLDDAPVDLDVVVLDVGGQIFKTTKLTLSKSPYFSALLEGQLEVKNGLQYIFLDKDPVYFAVVLEYLRSGDLVMKNVHLDSVLRDLNYFGFDTDKLQPTKSSNLLRFDITLDNELKCWKVTKSPNLQFVDIHKILSATVYYKTYNFTVIQSMGCKCTDGANYDNIMDSYSTLSTFPYIIGYDASKYIKISKADVLKALGASLPRICDNFHIFVQSDTHIVVYRVFQK